MTRTSFVKSSLRWDNCPLKVKKGKKAVRWNTNNLKKSEIKEAYGKRLDEKMEKE